MARRASRTSFGLAPRSPRVDLLKQRARGFTIVELLIVVVVIAILAAITIVSYQGITARANDAAVQNDLSAVAKKLQVYYVENGAYPQDTTQLAAAKIGASRGSYGRHATANLGDYNFLYCRPQSDPTRFALIASSASGNLFRWLDGSVTSMSRSNWDTFNVPSATLCSQAGITTGSAQLWAYQAGAWQSWIAN